MPESGGDPPGIGVDYHGLANQELYVDSRFSINEMRMIQEAANEWTYSTNGMVHFHLVWRDYIENHNFEAGTHRNEIIKTEASEPFVHMIDESLKKGYLTLGFLHRPRVDVQNYYLAIVMDRIKKDKQLKSVMMHELGHALGLVHSDLEKGIMNSGVDDRYGCLNRYDLLQFSDKFDVKIDTLKYCIN